MNGRFEQLTLQRRIMQKHERIQFNIADGDDVEHTSFILGNGNFETGIKGIGNSCQ